MTGGDMSQENIRFAMLKAAGKEVTENVSRFLRKKGKSRHELKMGVLQFFHDANEAEAIDEMITREGRADETASMELERLVESKLAGQFIELKASMDPLSKLVLGVWNDDDTKRPYWFVNEAAWIRGLEGDRPKGKPQFGQFGHISGKGTGKGKTSWGVRLAQITLRQPSYHVVTNIRFTPPDELGARVHFVSRLSDLFAVLLRIAMAGEYALVILDEQAFFFGRQDAMSEKVNHFDKLMKLFRKVHASGVLVGHDFDKDLPEKAKVFMTSRFEKRSLKELSVVIVADHYKLNERVVDVPDADWPFETYSTGGLAMDLDVPHMLEWLNAQNAGSTEHERVLLLDYLAHPEWWSEETPTPTTPAAGPPELDEYAAAAEVRANRERFFNGRGKPDVGAIRQHFRAYGISQDKAYAIARLAKAEG